MVALMADIFMPGSSQAKGKAACSPTDDDGKGVFIFCTGDFFLHSSKFFTFVSQCDLRMCVAAPGGSHGGLR